MCDSDNSLIYIERGMEKTRKAEVLIHEVIHFISTLYNLGLSEKKVNILGIALLAFLRENKLNFNE